MSIVKYELFYNKYWNLLIIICKTLLEILFSATLCNIKIIKKFNILSTTSFVTLNYFINIASMYSTPSISTVSRVLSLVAVTYIYINIEKKKKGQE